MEKRISTSATDRKTVVLFEILFAVDHENYLASNASYMLERQLTFDVQCVFKCVRVYMI